MKIKIYLFLFLILILFVNNYFNNENFYSAPEVSIHTVYRNYLEDEVKLLIARYEDGKNYTLSKEKALLTLFYDTNEPYSSNYYDDTELTDNSYMFSDNAPSLTDSQSRLMKSEFELDSENKKRMNVWNQFRQRYLNINKNTNRNTQDKYYKYLQMLELEEVKCVDGEMPKCVNFNKLSNNITISNNKLHKSFDKRQPPRPRDLVDKLPKVIFSFVKHLKNQQGNIEYEQEIIEYDGIYNYNDAVSTVGLNNLLDFIQSSYENYLNLNNLSITHTEYASSLSPQYTFLDDSDSDSVISSSYDNKPIIKCNNSAYYYEV